MIKGVKVTLGEQEYVLPPCSMDTLEELGPAVDEFMAVHKTGGQPSLTHMRVIVDLVHGALLRNYPHLTRKEVAMGIDLSNMTALFMAAMNVSMPPASEGAASNEGGTLGELTGAG